MKKNYRLYVSVFLNLLLFTVANAQTWPMPGAQWEYCRNSPLDYIRKFAYTKDTVINTNTYQVIEHLNVSPTPNLGSVYTRYSNDTVYRYVQAQEYPFLVFNAAIGDVYTTFRTNFHSFSDSTCRSILPVKIWDLDTAEFSSVNLKRWQLVDTLYDEIYGGGGGGFSSFWTVVERIGLMNDFPFTLNFDAGTGNSNSTSCSFPTDYWAGYTLNSYSDSTFSYGIAGNCLPTAVIQEPSGKMEITFYPNPASDFLNVSNLPENTTINIFNIYGQTVLQQFVLKGCQRINIETLPNGYYVLKCAGVDHPLSHSFIINR